MTSWPDRLAHELAWARDPQLSPDGSRVAYLLERALPAQGRPGTQAVAELWVADAELERARRAAAPAAGAACPRWAPDGRRVGFLADGRLLAVGAAGRGEVVELLAAPADETVGAFAWSPDGRRVAQLRSGPPDPEHAPRVVASPDFLLDGAGYTGGVRHRVVVVDLADGSERELAASAHPHASLSWSVADDAVAFVRTTIRRLRGQAWIAPPHGAPRAVGPRDGQAIACAFSPSGRRLLVVGRRTPAFRGTGYELLVHDAASGRLEHASDEYGGALRDARWLDEERVLVGGVRAGASELAVWRVGDGGAPRGLARAAALRAGLGVDAAGTRVVQEHASANAAGELVVRPLEGARETVSAHNRDLLAPAGAVAVERLRLGTAAAPLDAWVLRQAGDDAPRPLVLDLQGGPQGFYGEGFDLRQQCLVRSGFAVAFCNPPGSDGYGGDFAARANDRWGRELADVLRALDAVCELPFVDAERLGVMGFSYGGLMAAHALARTDRFRAGVCGCLVFDVESWLWTSEVGDPREYGFSAIERAALDAQSPSSVVDRIDAPVLLLHGEADLASPVAQSDWVYRALVRRGVPVAYVRYPHVAHTLSALVPGDMLARVTAWFAEHLRGGPS